MGKEKNTLDYIFQTVEEFCHHKNTAQCSLIYHSCHVEMKSSAEDDLIYYLASFPWL